mmetsp:Transcript_1848/g.4881  ORF Transcript_1848/g.4881 Transcript_1848/m.4881 type:complete len:87 (-) Transcript_1848:2628-2888(-)
MATNGGNLHQQEHTTSTHAHTHILMSHKNHMTVRNYFIVAIRSRMHFGDQSVLWSETEHLSAEENETKSNNATVDTSGKPTFQRNL